MKRAGAESPVRAPGRAPGTEAARAADFPAVGPALAGGTRFLLEAGVDGARVSAESLLSSLLGMPRHALYLEPGTEIEPPVAFRYRRLLSRRASGVPLQYLVGRVSFHGLDFTVRPGVFIPRPETELLVEAALGLVGPGEAVADVGAGTGVIGLTMALRGPVTATLFEKSGRAVANILENRHRLGIPDGRARVEAGDFFALADRLSPASFALLAANPPYVPLVEKGFLAPEIAREPARAIFSGRDGLSFIRRLVPVAAGLIRPGGWLCLEIGLGQCPEVSRLLEAGGFAGPPMVVRDYRGIERVIACRRALAGSNPKNGCAEN